MSNAPFKIAFWMMSLAFALTVILASLKPQEIRQALNRQPAAETANPFDHQVESSQGAIAFVEPAEERVQSKSVPAETNKTLVKQQSVVTTPTIAMSDFSKVPQRSAQLVRVASADPDLPLVLTQEECLAEAPLVPIPDQRFAYSDQEAAPELKIPVPEPIDIVKIQHASATPQVSELRGEVVSLQLADAKRQIEELRQEQTRSQLEQLKQDLLELRQQMQRSDLASESSTERTISVAKVVEPQEEQPERYQRSEESLAVSADVQKDEKESSLDYGSHEKVSKVNHESVVEVSEGESQETFNFRFEHVSIKEVLMTLGKYGGRRVVLSSDIEGTFSGEFPNTTANQAFAAVIKANQFGLSFRGDYVLVRSHRDPKIR